MEEQVPFKMEIKRDEKGRIVKGSAAINPEGRPKGKTMKEFARDFLMLMTDKEKEKWLKGLSPEIVWRMAEGNPHQTSENENKEEVTVNIKKHHRGN